MIPIHLIVRTLTEEEGQAEGGSSDEESGLRLLMSDIFSKVVATVIKNSTSNLTAKNCSIDFLQDPTMAPKSADRHNTSRPDGYMLSKIGCKGRPYHGQTLSFRASISGRKGMKI
jgi:hypothetical protein